MRRAAGAKISSTWVGQKAWPAFRLEAEIVLRAAGVITAVLWLKRIIEQLLGSKLINESIIRGQWNDLIKDEAIEADVRSRL